MAHYFLLVPSLFSSLIPKSGNSIHNQQIPNYQANFGWYLEIVPLKQILI